MTLKASGVNDLNYTDNLQWGSAAWVAMIFILVKRVSDSRRVGRYINKVCVTMANYSFGVYLIHAIVINFGIKLFLKNYRMMEHPVLESFLIVVITITLCVGIIKLINIYKPAGKWLFGLNNKKK